MTFDNMSLEHTVPLCRGGMNTPDNITIVTKDIQKMKGVMTGEEFVDLCKVVACHKG